MNPHPTQPTNEELDDPVLFCENTVAAMGGDPAAARVAPASWAFYAGRTEIRLFIFRRTYLFCSAPINRLPPDKDPGTALAYLLGTPFYPYQAGIDENRVFLSCRIHLSDLTPGHAGKVRETLVRLPGKAEELAAHLDNAFGCPYTAPESATF